MTDNLNLCMGCMNELEPDGTCAKCGYSGSIQCHPYYLPPESYVNKRYLIGKLLSFNGESAVYIGFDTLLNKKVFVREFCPESLCSRNGLSISADAANLVKFKNYQAEFIDLYKSLMKLKSLTHLISVYDIAFDNNTAYAVYDFYEGITLEEYFRRSGNILSWNDLKKLLPPILTTLSLLHNTGRIHLGISPENIWVTTKGDIKIDGLCLTDERLSDSDLVPELFPGYSAPEQYISNGTLGTWTDVYAVCAIISRALTGKEPCESLVRFVNDPMKELCSINPSIPMEVSDIVKAGMAVVKENRIQNINDLVSRLFSQPQYDNRMAEDKKRTSGKTAATKKQKNNKKGFVESFKNFKYRIPVIVGLTTVLVLGIFMSIFLFAISRDKFADADTTTFETGTSNESASDENSIIMMGPTSDNSSVLSKDHESINDEEVKADGDTAIMPNLIGIDYESIVRSEKVQNIITIQAVYEYSDTVEKGLVIKQSIREDTVISVGTTVSVTISKGSSVVKVPDYNGVSQKDYLAILDSLNIKYNVESMDTYEVATGYVVRTSKPIGDKIDLLANETLTVYIANNLADRRE